MQLYKKDLFEKKDDFRSLKFDKKNFLNSMIGRNTLNSNAFAMDNQLKLSFIVVSNDDLIVCCGNNTQNHRDNCTKNDTKR